METNYLYLLLDLGALSMPFAFSFHPRGRFADTWYALFPAMLLTGIIFVAWDVAFTELGVWGFNSKYILGINLWGLPLEELLFFVVVPYACLFSYHAAKVLGLVRLPAKATYIVSWVLVLGALAVVVFTPFRWYTTLNFSSFALVVFVLGVWLKREFLRLFYVVYLFILIPFFLMNGVLTGTGIDEEVVWYAASGNLGIRMFTIPIEDTFYGFSLLLLNAAIYDWIILRRLAPKTNA